jgi:hypothetical protein
MSDALTGFATGNRTGKPAEREQQILTPQCILDVCTALWGAIHLDPCAASVTQPIATKNYYGHNNDPRAGGNGLTDPWCNYAYVNPPYKHLKLWLAKSLSEVAKAQEQILLFPVRTNRVWWCDYVRLTPTAVSWLKPLKFKGYKQAFPAPLVLVYTGNNSSDFRYYVKDLACYVGGRL